MRWGDQSSRIGRKFIMVLVWMGVGIAIPGNAQPVGLSMDDLGQRGFPSLQRSLGLTQWDRDFVGGVEKGQVIRIFDSVAYTFESRGMGFQLIEKRSLPSKPEAKGTFMGGPQVSQGGITWITAREIFRLEGGRWLKIAEADEDWIPGLNPAWHEVRGLGGNRLLIVGGPKNWIECLDLTTRRSIWSVPFPLTTKGKTLPGHFRQPSVLLVEDDAWVFLPYCGRIFRADLAGRSVRELDDLPWKVDDRDVGHEGRAHRIPISTGEGLLQPWPLAAVFLPTPQGDPLVVACFQPEVPMAGLRTFEIRGNLKLEVVDRMLPPSGFWTASGGWAPMSEISLVEVPPGAPTRH